MKIILTKKLVFWYYKLVAENGKTLMTSETYYKKSNAQYAAGKVANELGLAAEEAK